MQKRTGETLANTFSGLKSMNTPPMIIKMVIGANLKFRKSNIHQ